MIDAVTAVPTPVNETVQGYAPGSSERASLAARLSSIVADGPVTLTATIGGEQVEGTGPVHEVVVPHEHSRVLGRAAAAGAGQARAAVAAARAAAPAWRSLSIDDRAAVFLRAAALLSGPWRDTINAATMLGQSKSVQQAEIDAVCELADFWRFNVAFARQLYADQPVTNSAGTWNRLDHRPLEGFVYAITPFNFTSIAGNLPTAPALMGNTVIWKPSPTQGFAAHFTMRLLEEAGLPPGVINLLPGVGPEISEVLLADPDLAGIHFTGSTATFRHLWRAVADHLDGYRSYPRLVGETGGKDFVLALPDADVDAVNVALLLGSFEYSGQKCSAASRAFVPASMWPALRDRLAAGTDGLGVGDVTGDLSMFTGAVIDDRAFAKHRAVFDRARSVDSISVLAGATADDSVGWFVRPTVLVGTDPTDEIFTTEYFGPILSLHVYQDSDLDAVVAGIDTATPYGLTGAVLGRDRAQLARLTTELRFAAGNFYINDKPTGAVVGQQPFGGARASGTDDKAGAASNLLRWTATRAIKENLDPPRSIGYPHLG